MASWRGLCPGFAEVAFDCPACVLELAFAASVTVGRAPRFGGAERRWAVLCPKQTRRTQLMTACAERGLCGLLGIRH